MSDYLWDKTGEPDADVEELENLLGALKHQPRPLEIPATDVPGTTAARPATITTIFSRPRFAIAASLILMLLAGAWLVTKQGKRQPDRMATVGTGSPAPESARPQTAVVENNRTLSVTPIKEVEQPKLRGDKNSIIQTADVKRHRPSRQSGAERHKQQQPRRVKEDARLPQPEEVAVTQEEREATEKVMLALRLASAKLNYAQRELREISRVEK